MKTQRKIRIKNADQCFYPPHKNCDKIFNNFLFCANRSSERIEVLALYVLCLSPSSNRSIHSFNHLFTATSFVEPVVLPMSANCNSFCNLVFQIFFLCSLHVSAIFKFLSELQGQSISQPGQGNYV